MTTIRDMSYWLELERQKTSSALKTIAFASAAHEFRNPLNGILNSLQLMAISNMDM
jgi:signal transduction histidine kinase